VIEDAGGGRILVNPIVAEAAHPYLIRCFGNLVQIHRPFTARLEQIGLTPNEIDFVILHHLHFQDLRPLTQIFPKTRILVQEMELAWSRHLHPLDALFYVPAGADLAFDGIQGFMDLGRSLRLIPTPGCTPGHQTLIVRMPEGIATFSSNGVSVDSYYPEGNRLDLEVLPPWATSWSPQGQYDSMLLEKCIASPHMTYTTTALSGSRKMKVSVGRLSLPDARRFTPRFRVGALTSTRPTIEEPETSDDLLTLSTTSVGGD